jgi:hypothetical protein
MCVVDSSHSAWRISFACVYSVFGYLTPETLGVLDDIQVVKCKNKKPVEPIKIFTASVLENPWQDEELPEGTAIPEKPLVQEKKKCSIQ